MRLGILEMVGLAATLVFAVPAGLLGVQLFLDGQTSVGAALVAVAALMVLLPRYVTTPDDVPATLAEKAVETTVAEPHDTDDASRE